MLRLFKNWYFWLLVLLLVGALFLMSHTATHRENLSSIEKIIRETYTPMQRGVSTFKTRTGSWSGVFSDKGDLQREINELQKENQRLALENQFLREYRQEVDRLRILIGFEESNQDRLELLPARVIARSPGNWYRYLVIDRGLKDGLRKGMPVIHPSGLVGRVENVSNSSAQVSLLTDRETAVGVIVEETRDTSGIVEGLGNSRELRMINIPYYSQVKKGNRIVTSGLSISYPQGIYIGKVTSVIREPNGLLLTATVQPAVNFDRLEEVLVVTAFNREEFASVSEATEED